MAFLGEKRRNEKRYELNGWFVMGYKLNLSYAYKKERWETEI